MPFEQTRNIDKSVNCVNVSALPLISVLLWRSVISAFNLLFKLTVQKELCCFEVKCNELWKTELSFAKNSTEAWVRVGLYIYGNFAYGKGSIPQATCGWTDL